MERLPSEKIQIEEDFSNFILVESTFPNALKSVPNLTKRQNVVMTMANLYELREKGISLAEIRKIWAEMPELEKVGDPKSFYNFLQLFGNYKDKPSERKSNFFLQHFGQ